MSSTAALSPAASNRRAIVNLSIGLTIILGLAFLLAWGESLAPIVATSNLHDEVINPYFLAIQLDPAGPHG